MMGTGFFNTGPRPEREPSRPRFVNPRTQLEQSWQRASNYAAPIESPFGLIKHQTRQVVRGFNARADLARMALTQAIIGDKIDEVIATALSAAEDEAKANNGTAVHAALQLCDTGREVPEEYRPHATNYVAELRRHNLRPVAVEQRVLNTRLGATGTFDRVYVTDTGRYLTGDIKSGRIDHAHKFGVQLEVYSGADYIVHPDGRSEPMPWPLDQTAALIIHVDPETGATSIYEVPLHIARWGAALAEQVRAFQRTDILLPYSGAPGGPLAADLHREATDQQIYRVHGVTPDGQGLIEDAAELDEGDAAAVVGHIEQHPPAQSVVPQLGAVVAGVDLDQRARAAVTPEGQPAEVPDGPLEPTEIEAARKLKIELGEPSYVRRMLALLVPKNDKAKLQRMLSDLGGTDLAHNRKWLAERIIAMQNSNKLNPARASVQMAQTIEQGVPSAEATPFMLKQISEAQSLADIERIYDNVVQQSGPSAWTEAMKQVAAARAAELDKPAPATSPLSRIADAKSTQDLAVVWSDITSDGANVGAWTAAYQSAALKRAEEIKAAQPVNINPWGSQ